MNIFLHQMSTPPCSGNVAFIGGTAGLSFERRQEIRKEYEEHTGQWRLNYLLKSQLPEDINWLTVYDNINKMWSEELDSFLQSHTFIGYFQNDERFPIFEAK